MNLRLSLVMISLIMLPILSNAQNPQKTYSLEEVINLALDRSPDAMMAKHRLLVSHWSYKSHKASTLPKIFFDADLPSFNRSISKVQQNDGTYAFRDIYNVSAGGGLSLSQNIGATGTRMFLRTNLERSADFLSTDSTWSTSFLSNPLQFQIQQPIFQFNQFKWNKKIEPLKYDEAVQNYLQQREDVVIRAINIYFDLLTAQINYQVNQDNLENNKEIYKIAQGRFEIGTIAENELLQLELNLLTSTASVESLKLEYDNKLFRFRSFLKLNQNEIFELTPPTEIMALEVDPDKATRLAWENNTKTIEFKRRELQALMSVDRAKKENSVGFDLYANYGLSNNADNLEDVYTGLKQSQIVTLGMNVPILDWGEGKGKVQMAESELELTKLQLEQDRIDFEQDALLQIKQFNMQKYQLEIAEKKDKVAMKSFEIAKQRFLVGKIDNLNYNDAQSRKDESKVAYLNQLKSYWVKYYEVRKLTLYDFINNQPLEFEIGDVLK